MQKNPTRFGLPSLNSAAGVVGCACGATNSIAAPLGAVGLGGAALGLHLMLLALAPLNLLLLGPSFRRHRDPKGLLVASIGILFIFGHLVDPIHLRFGAPVEIYAGVALLAIGAVLDWRAKRRPVCIR